MIFKKKKKETTSFFRVVIFLILMSCWFVKLAASVPFLIVRTRVAMNFNQPVRTKAGWANIIPFFFFYFPFSSFFGQTLHAAPSHRQEYSNFPEFHPFLSSCCDICQYDITFRSTRVRPFVCRGSQRELKSLGVYDGSWKVAWEISIWEPFWRGIHENGFNSISTGIDMGFYEEDLRVSSIQLRNNVRIMNYLLNPFF